MNLQEQLGALESSLDTLLRTAAASPATPAALGPTPGPAPSTAPEPAPAPTARETVAPAPSEPPSLDAPPPAEPAAIDATPTLTVSRPHRDAIEMSIGGKSVLLSPEGISELIDELSNVRASMSVEQPAGIAPGWRFAATRDPVMATKKQPNGDRLLILRHGGHGWVPYTFSPNMVIELYAMLTKK
jgi:hypothetical protein